MIKRILAIDIGNTAATVGFYEAGRLLEFKSLSYSVIPKYAKKKLKSGSCCYLDVVISSVFPKITSFLKCNLQNINGLRLWVAGGNLPVKINHKYSNYSKLGVDRKVNIYGATRIYTLPILVIDYGTAITFDYVDARGVFRGGMIVPGPKISLSALSKTAALLPRIPFPKSTRSFSGRDTRSCMEAGVLEGYGAMTDELIQRFRKKYGKDLRVLATGGLAEVIHPYTKHIDIIDPQHSVKSLLALWREHASR